MKKFLFGTRGIAVVAVQLELCKLGYLSSEVVDDWGKVDVPTMSAVMRMQIDLHLERDGVLDARVMRSLLEQWGMNLHYVFSLPVDSLPRRRIFLEYYLRGVLN